MQDSSVTWSKILIIIDIQISDSGGDRVAEAFCLGQRGEGAGPKGRRNQVKCVPGVCLGYLDDSETCRWASDAPVTLLGRKCLLFIWGVSAGATSEPL